MRRAEAGESIYRATLNSAGEISFTILSMTLSLAAVFIPLALVPRMSRPNLPRIRHYHHRHSRLRPGLLNPDSAHVFAHPGGTETGTSQDLDGANLQPLLRTRSSVLQSFARLVSRPRLARGANHRDLRGRGLVFL